MANGFIPPHGGYQDLLSYQKSVIVYDVTVKFCSRFLGKFDRTVDQMVQAARSGKQNIIEGSMASGTSKQTEIKLTNVARASLEELLEDYRDYLRTNDARCGIRIPNRRCMSADWGAARMGPRRLMRPIEHSSKAAVVMWLRTSPSVWSIKPTICSTSKSDSSNKPS